MTVNSEITKVISIIESGHLFPNCPSDRHVHTVQIIFHFAGFEELTERIFDLYKFIDEKLMVEIEISTTLQNMLKSLLKEFSYIAGLEKISVSFMEFPEIKFSISD